MKRSNMLVILEIVSSIYFLSSFRLIENNSCFWRWRHHDYVIFLLDIAFLRYYLIKKRLIRDQICHNMTILFSTRRSSDDVYELIPYKRNPRRNQDRTRIPLYLCCWPWPISITISLILFRSAVRKVIDNFTPLKSIPLCSYKFRIIFFERVFVERKRKQTVLII